MNDDFDENEYLGLHEDVASAVANGTFKSGLDHYKKFGKQEGRILRKLFTGQTSREHAVFRLINRKGQGLEIGPSHNPIAPKKKGYKVHVVDHATANELRKKYSAHGVNLDNIEEVDFVWKGQPLSELVGKTEFYDWIIASHVIEHIPDLVSFFQQCDKLLKPSGILSLVIPDKRYCFDYFQSLSSTGGLLEAYAEKRIKPTAGQVFDHFSNASSRNGAIAWSSNRSGGADALVHKLDDALVHWQKAINSPEYIDVHCWRFTPESFRLIMSDLFRLGLTNLRMQAEFPTSGCEFYVSLGKTQKSVDFEDHDRLALLVKIKS